MYQHAIAICYSGDDSRRHVVLNFKNVRCLEVPVISLGPELRSRLSVNQLGDHTNPRAAFTDASLEHVTGAKFGTESPLVPRLPLQSRRRAASDDRQIPKP